MKNGEQTGNMVIMVMEARSHWMVFSENPMVMVALNQLSGS
jgi:hypothetical protein